MDDVLIHSQDWTDHVTTVKVAGPMQSRSWSLLPIASDCSLTLSIMFKFDLVALSLPRTHVHFPVGYLSILIHYKFYSTQMHTRMKSVNLPNHSAKRECLSN